jgi:hypothetical protein
VSANNERWVFGNDIKEVFGKRLTPSEGFTEEEGVKGE